MWNNGFKFEKGKSDLMLNVIPSNKHCSEVDPVTQKSGELTFTGCVQVELDNHLQFGFLQLIAGWL